MLDKVLDLPAYVPNLFQSSKLIFGFFFFFFMILLDEADANCCIATGKPEVTIRKVALKLVSNMKA